MSHTRGVTSTPTVVASTPNGEARLTDLEAQLHTQSAPTSPDSDRNARSPVEESLDIINRRIRRSPTSRSYRPKPIAGRQWKPGQEPGIDPHAPHPGLAPVNEREECQITVVDYSQHDIQIRELNNEQLFEFMEEAKDESLTCRWINVNGISWDVISLLGRKKKFHRLALEDMLHLRNRTKADWYSDHTYMVLPLQKLIRISTDDSDDEEDPDTNSLVQEKTHTEPPPKLQKKSWPERMSRKVKNHYSNSPEPYSHADPSLGRPELSKSPSYGHASITAPTGIGKSRVRTLQRYGGSANLERAEYMEMHSVLRSKGLAVSVEQVSIFLTADNTVVSFFEHSADDIEEPIINRLASPETILRRSCDASMLVQAVLDAIVDLAMPVTFAYKDAIDELELNVLTDPAIQHTHSLYMMISEIGTFRANISPTVSLISALRDHKSAPSTPPPIKDGQGATFNIKDSSDSSVIINPTAYTYLGDVEDHILLITDGLDQMRNAADNMINLIFNTISAYQNEAMRNLTNVTIVFLPLTFITGYFGMNFPGIFPGISDGEGVWYFWAISIPVSLVFTVMLLRDSMIRSFVRWRQRRRVRSVREKRRLAKTSHEGKAKIS